MRKTLIVLAIVIFSYSFTLPVKAAPSLQNEIPELWEQPLDGSYSDEIIQLQKNALVCGFSIDM